MDGLGSSVGGWVGEEWIVVGGYFVRFGMGVVHGVDGGVGSGGRWWYRKWGRWCS